MFLVYSVTQSLSLINTSLIIDVRIIWVELTIIVGGGFNLIWVLNAINVIIIEIREVSVFVLFSITTEIVSSVLNIGADNAVIAVRILEPVRRSFITLIESTFSAIVDIKRIADIKKDGVSVVIIITVISSVDVRVRRIARIGEPRAVLSIEDGEAGMFRAMKND